MTRIRPSRVAASNDRSLPFAMFSQHLDQCPLRAETAPISAPGKARLPAHLRRSRSRPATTTQCRLDPFVKPSGNDRCLRAPCKGGAFQWVQVPPGQTFQPEATGAVMEVTKWLKPSV